MGLANLVPGISGGTMLLAAGVYQSFIESIAELTTLRIRLRPVLLLGIIAEVGEGQHGNGGFVRQWECHFF